jgi:hypothetical protein
MKHLIAFTFAACLLNSLAFADNPTDAPPMFSNTDAPAAREQARADKHRRHDKKQERCSPRAKSEVPPGSDRQPEQSNREYPPAAITKTYLVPKT